MERCRCCCCYRHRGISKAETQLGLFRTRVFLGINPIIIRLGPYQGLFRSRAVRTEFSGQDLDPDPYSTYQPSFVPPKSRDMAAYTVHRLYVP